LDHDTEENGNNDKYHRPGYENGCNNLSEAGSPHIRRSVALIMYPLQNPCLDGNRDRRCDDMLSNLLGE
jgi:hypothetical protein